MQLIFEREGYRVTSANSCAEALALLSDGALPLDGVITDLNMEREDIGFEVVRAARKLLPPPVVIICTGYANPSNSRLALDLRVDYLAIKPVDVEELRGAVARLLARRASGNGKAS